ncbi:hypothetical protein JL721_9596 [Aureococcus anophagefferens]|nr:hypothetical protein JL721_9596 [Aureococcus anophagefferens]
MVRRLLLVGAAAAAARIVFPAPYAVNVGGDALVDVLVEGLIRRPPSLGRRRPRLFGARRSRQRRRPVAGHAVCEVAEVADVRASTTALRRRPDAVPLRARLRALGLQDGRAGEVVVLRVAPLRPALNIGQWHLDPGSFGDSGRLAARLAAKADNLRYYTAPQRRSWLRLAPAPTCQRIQRLYGHQPLALILEGKCGFVDGKGEALVVVDFGSPSLLSADDAPGPAATQAAAGGRAISLKRRLRARHLELDVPVPDFVHGTVDRCEAARDAFFFTGRRLADLAALAASDPPVANGRRAPGAAGAAGDDKTPAAGTASAPAVLPERDRRLRCSPQRRRVRRRPPRDAGPVGGRPARERVAGCRAGVGETSWPGAGATRFEWSEHHYGTVIAGRRGWVEIRQWDADEGFGHSAPSGGAATS